MDQVLPWQQVISGVATCCSGSACWMWRLHTHFHRSAEHRRRIKSPRCLPSLRSSSVSSSFNGGCWTGENNRMTSSCHAVAVGQGSLILCRYFFAWTRRRLWSWFGRARLLGCLQVVSRLRAHHVCQQRVHAVVLRPPLTQERSDLLHSAPRTPRWRTGRSLPRRILASLRSEAPTRVRIGMFLVERQLASKSGVCLSFDVVLLMDFVTTRLFLFWKRSGKQTIELIITESDWRESTVCRNRQESQWASPSSIQEPLKVKL